MKIKRWNDFLSYIKESKEDAEFNPWMLDEDDIRDYFQESIDEGYQIEVRYGFVGEERMWNYKESKSHSVERFTKKMESGNNTPAISILITSEKVSSNDVSDNLKFAYSIIAEEADADISILSITIWQRRFIGDIEGIIAKGGLFFTEIISSAWNNHEGKEPAITEADGYVEFLVKKKQQIKITQTQLAKYYDWYPDYYHLDAKAMTFLGHHHDWMNMNYVKEELKTDKQIDPNLKEYLAYTKTSARIQGVDKADELKTNQQFLDAIAKADTIQHYEKKGAVDSTLLKEGRAALINSIAYNPEGTFGG